MTDDAYNAWLAALDVRRCVLIEVVARVSGVETTRYLSNTGYVTGAADTPANAVYLPIIAGGVTFTERISLDGSASLSFGDIEIDNPNGERDAWLQDVWVNRAVAVYFGDPGWARADFRLIFSGVVADLDSRAAGRLNLKLRDKLQRLNTPLTETKLGGGTANKERLLPLTFGECHNVTPLLTNPATLEYQVHGGAIEGVIEVRDSGVPVSATPTVATGKFTLAATPSGEITCSAQGDKPSAYSTNIATLVERLATGYGQATSRFSAGDLDAANLAAFAAAHTQPVGLYADDRMSVLEACQQLAASVGAQVVMSRAGLLQLIQIALPPSGTPAAITAADMLAGSLQIEERRDVVAAVRLGYCHNWTPEQNLQTGIPDEHKAMYAAEWLDVTASDSAVATTYRLHAEPPREETCLLVEADANAECTRRLNLRKVPRTVYRFTGFARMLTLALGQAVTLTHDRFGLSGGATGMVVGLAPDWLGARATVWVLV